MSETWHGKYRFRANRPKRGFVEIVDEEGHASGAVVYYDAPIDRLAPHPDGVRVRSGRQDGLVSRNDKGCWTLSLLPSQDLAPSGHDGAAAV